MLSGTQRKLLATSSAALLRLFVGLAKFSSGQRERRMIRRLIDESAVTAEPLPNAARAGYIKNEIMPRPCWISGKRRTSPVPPSTFGRISGAMHLSQWTRIGAAEIGAVAAVAGHDFCSGSQSLAATSPLAVFTPASTGAATWASPSAPPAVAAVSVQQHHRS